MFNFSTVLENFHNLSACYVIHNIYGFLWFSTMFKEDTTEFIPHFQTPSF